MARFSMLEYALIEGEAHPTCRSVVVDVSLGGLQVRSRSKFAQGEKLRLSIGRLEKSPMNVLGEVRYSVPVPETDLFSTGFSIVPTTPDERIQWGDYVHAIFQASADQLI